MPPPHHKSEDKPKENRNCMVFCQSEGPKSRTSNTDMDKTGEQDFYLNLRIDAHDMKSHDNVIKAFAKKADIAAKKELSPQEFLDCLSDMCVVLASKAIGHFGHSAKVDEVYAAAIDRPGADASGKHKNWHEYFVVVQVKQLVVDDAAGGFCMLPDFFNTIMGSLGCDASIHGQYNDHKPGYEFPSNRCGFTLPIFNEEVAQLVSRNAQLEYQVKLNVMPQTPEKEKQHLQEVGIKDEEIPKKIKAQAPRVPRETSAQDKSKKDDQKKEGADSQHEQSKKEEEKDDQPIKKSRDHIM